MKLAIRVCQLGDTYSADVRHPRTIVRVSTKVRPTKKCYLPFTRRFKRCTKHLQAVEAPTAKSTTSTKTERNWHKQVAKRADKIDGGQANALGRKRLKVRPGSVERNCIIITR